MKGKLYLIPATLGECSVEEVIPALVMKIVNTIDNYIVENERSARRYLRKLNISKSIDQLNFFVLDKHTPNEEVSSFLDSAEKGNNIGLISEAGCPAVADPGATIVLNAHRLGIRVIPLTGPSSILLALMASGLDGQNFSFNGYLPIKGNERTQQIKLLERRSQQEKQTQIFMEAPYRNNQLLNDILKTCDNSTSLCIAADISLESEAIATKTVAQWKKITPDLHKKPAIFILRKF